MRFWILLSVIIFCKCLPANTEFRQLVGFEDGKCIILDDPKLYEQYVKVGFKKIRYENIRLKHLEKDPSSEGLVEINILPATPVTKLKTGEIYIKEYTIELSSNVGLKDVVVLIPTFERDDIEPYPQWFIPDWYIPITFEIKTVSDLKSGKVTKLIFQSHKGLQLDEIIVFSGGSEVATNLRKPLSDRNAEILFDLNGDRDPVRKKYIKPEYDGPEDGKVSLTLTISKTGTVKKTEVIESTNEGWAKACQRAAKRWLYRPRMKDWKHVESTVTVPFNFKAKDYYEARRRAERWF